MNTRGQSALEYLMTYGWALIVIAIVIGVLIFVTSSSTGGANCSSSNSQFVVKEWTIASGADRVGLTLQNATGGDIAVGGFYGAGDFNTSPIASSQNPKINATACGTTNGANTDAGHCTAPVAVTSSQYFTVTNWDGPTAAKTLTTGTGLVLNYTTQGGLPATVKVTCSGNAQ